MQEKDKFTNMISAILALLIIGTLGFVIYKCFIKINNNTNQGSNNNYEERKLSASDLKKIGLEKYNMLYSKNNYSSNAFIFFKDNDVNIYNLSNQDKLHVLYSFLSDEDKNKTGTYDENCFLNKGVYTRLTYPSTCPKETFDRNILLEKLYDNFDNNMTIKDEDFFASSSNKCYISDSVYNCYLNTSDFSINKYKTFTKYDSAIQVDGNIEITSYLLTARIYPESSYGKGIYSNASATNKIDDLPFEIGDTITPELTDKLVNLYKDKITKYKSTFKIENDKYLWQKTEIVK